MSGRGRKAVPPPAGHHVEPPLGRGGIIVTITNNAGHRKEFDFAELAVAEPMQRSLAAAFAAQSRGWTGHLTAEFYWNKLVLFAGFVSRLEDPPADLDGMTAAMLKRWRAAHVASSPGRHTLASVRTLLRRDLRLASGPAAEELARRIPRAKPSKQSYAEAERDQVVLAARRQFRAALMRIRENSSLLERWRAGDLAEGSREERMGRILDHLACTGDVPRTVSQNGKIHVTNWRLLGGTSVEKSWGRLFLTRMELTALAVLLTDAFGWNLSAYGQLPTPTRAPSAGEARSVT
uniref:hypothetical protein n=1 Tax=Amycolatopsis sp. CA-096443 TaxID=3239919 RepID=UPI003F49A35F